MKSEAQKIMHVAKNKAQVIIAKAEVLAQNKLDIAEDKALKLVVTKEDIAFEIRTTVNGKIEHLRQEISADLGVVKADILWLKWGIKGLLGGVGVIVITLIFNIMLKGLGF